MSPIINKSIGGALTTESGSNVSGRAGVNRGAQPGPHQANPEGVSGSQAGSGSKVAADLHEVQIENQFPQEAQGKYVVDGAIDTHPLGTNPIGAQKSRNGQRSRSFSVPTVGKRGGSLTRRQVVPPRWPASPGACFAWWKKGTNAPACNSRPLCLKRWNISVKALSRKHWGQNWEEDPCKERWG